MGEIKYPNAVQRLGHRLAPYRIWSCRQEGIGAGVYRFPRPDLAELFLAKYALRVEVADAPALRAGAGVDHRVDQGRLTGVHRLVDRAFQLVRSCRIDTDATERFHHLVVARVLHEDGRGDVRATAGIDVGAPIDAVVVEDHDADGQVVAADGFDLHAGETKGAVAFNSEHRFAGFDGGPDRKTHADAHHSPR